MRHASAAALLTVAALMGAACAPTWVPSASARSSERYVSLGDSWVSGPLIAGQVGDPIDCGRSDRNFASLLARRLDVSAFTDASCGGADIDDLFEPQKATFGGRAPAQLDALTPDTTLVTLGIGGNDAGISDAALKCINLLPIALGPAPFGTPCVGTYTRDGDRIARRTEEARDELLDALAAIHDRAPDARILLLGYGAAFEDTGDGCWPYIPLLPPDVEYIRSKMLAFNRMLTEVAAEGDATYVDLWSLTRGHDLCKPYGVAWINGLAIDPPGIPAHPNQLYHEAVAAHLAEVLRPGAGTGTG